MRQRLILHIGTHKTGSTTIQNYLYYNRLWLGFWNLNYPMPINGPMFYRNNHNDLRDTAQSEGKPRDPGIHAKFGAHDALLGKYIRRIKEKGQKINVLSCEGWSSHLNRYARRLAPLQQHFDVKVVAFMRRPDYWIERFYAQRITNVEHVETRSFSEFMDQPHIETYLYNRSRMFGWWAKAFGDDAIDVIPYEPAAPDFDLIGRFLGVCNLSGSRADRLLLRNARSNPTLSQESLEDVRARLAKGKVVIRSEIQRLKRSKGPPPRFLDIEQRARILKEAEPDMAQICTRFVRDGRQSLFSDDPERASFLEKSG